MNIVLAEKTGKRTTRSWHTYASTASAIDAARALQRAGYTVAVFDMETAQRVLAWQKPSGASVCLVKASS